MKKFTLIIIVCLLLSGCANLMRAEKERALLESYESGKITKVEYLSKKSLLEMEYSKGPGK